RATRGRAARGPPAPSRPVGPLSPAVRQLIAEHSLDPASIHASGKGGRLTKEDVVTHLERAGKDGGTQVAAVAALVQAAPRRERPATLPDDEGGGPMGRLRKRVAGRLRPGPEPGALTTRYPPV